MTLADIPYAITALLAVIALEGWRHWWSAEEHIARLERERHADEQLLRTWAPIVMRDTARRKQCREARRVGAMRRRRGGE